MPPREAHHEGTKDTENKRERKEDGNHERHEIREREYTMGEREIGICPPSFVSFVVLYSLRVLRGSVVLIPSFPHGHTPKPTNVTVEIPNMCPSAFHPGNDFLMVADGLSAVTVMRPDGSLSTEVAHALRQEIRTEEAKRSRGRYTASDAVWHLPAAELPERPRLGDVVVDATGQHWTILNVQEATQGSRWRCVTRNLAIVHGLDQTVTIEKATYTKSPSGASETTWQPWRTGLPARIQPRRLEVEERHDRLSTAAKFTVFLAENVAVDHTHRIQGPDGTRYRILGSRRTERIDALMEIDVIRLP